MRVGPILLGRLPRPTLWAALELALLALIAVQGARLLWILATPAGPVGDWKAPAATAAPAAAALGEFDPFFRLADGGPGAVTSLNLKLYGVREDRATGRGSAIVALPDGTQSSFAVGEEIMPGVTLAEVAFDHVVIDRGGAREQLFLDQSEAATPQGPAQAETGPPPPAVAPPPPPTAPPPIRIEPRISGGQISGIAVAPGGDGGQAFRAAGFAPGDVIVSVNGQRVTSMERARALLRRSGGSANVVVERDGRAVPLRVRIDL